MRERNHAITTGLLCAFFAAMIAASTCAGCAPAIPWGWTLGFIIVGGVAIGMARRLIFSLSQKH